jgi:hypothetical protein
MLENLPGPGLLYEQDKFISFKYRGIWILEDRLHLGVYAVAGAGNKIKTPGTELSHIVRGNRNVCFERGNCGREKKQENQNPVPAHSNSSNLSQIRDEA